MHFYSKSSKYKQSVLRTTVRLVDNMSQQTPSRIDELIRASWTADAPPDYRIWTNAIINDPESPIQALRTTLTALTDENRSQIFARQFLDQLSDDIQPLKYVFDPVPPRVHF